jgi:hypothetical protein
MANHCVTSNVSHCRLTSSVTAVTNCKNTMASCLLTQTVVGGCTNATVTAFGKCNASTTACTNQVFNPENLFEFGQDVTLMTAGNVAGQKALNKNPACMQKLSACHELIDSSYARQDISTACDDIGSNRLTKLPCLENTAYPTWKTWVDNVCVKDAARTPSPTSAPVIIAKVSKKTAFTSKELSTVCDVMNTVAFRDGIIGVKGSLKCSKIQEQVAARRRLLNTTTSTLYSVTGSISFIQAKSAQEVFALIGVDAFALAVKNEITSADPKLGAAAVVYATPITTGAPTNQPTPNPTSAPPTTAATPTQAPPTEFSSSTRAIPTLIAVASVVLALSY